VESRKEEKEDATEGEAYKEILHMITP